MRLANASLVPSLGELGLNNRTLVQLKEIMRHGEGAILLSGSTGSGKTTTLYSMIRELRDNGSTVSSIEDPVEIELEGIAQTSIGDESSGLDYIACLKAVLRQDPDIIMVGELRDKQSAISLLQAALSGHLVLSTVHAASVFQILPRLSLLGLDGGLVSDAVSMLVFQRLVPRLCGRCRVTDLLASQRVGFETFRAVGCTSCHQQGYAGRILVNESLMIDESIRSRAFARDNLEHLKDSLLESGSYVPQSEQLEALARRGEIDSRELVSTTKQLHGTSSPS
jgi:type II secretory ATPase GspE/PulE/Tfp pilus assembly ATPase PilB-like protein